MLGSEIQGAGILLFNKRFRTNSLLGRPCPFGDDSGVESKLQIHCLATWEPERRP